MYNPKPQDGVQILSGPEAGNRGTVLSIYHPDRTALVKVADKTLTTRFNWDWLAPWPTPLADIRPEQVMVAYSGRPGCGCGCRGIYRVNPAMVERATEDRGYGYQANEISMPTVTRILRAMQKRALEVRPHHQFPECRVDELGEPRSLVIYSVEDERRYYWVFVPTTS